MVPRLTALIYNNIKHILPIKTKYIHFPNKEIEITQAANTNQSEMTGVSDHHRDLCRTVPLPAEGRDATALPGLRAPPTDVALADTGCEQTQCNSILPLQLNQQD